VTTCEVEQDNSIFMLLLQHAKKENDRTKPNTKKN
jgi:hypothetical protein